MRHAFVDIADKTMCSRCGNEVFRVDEVCPAVSDGQIYQGKPLTEAERQALDNLIAENRAIAAREDR